MSQNRIYEYEGRDIIVRYEAKRCIHAEECVHGLAPVFDPNRRPWIDPQRGEADAIASVVRKCPTGALKFERRDGGAGEEPPLENLVEVVADGPLYVAGRLELQRPNREPEAATSAALCRCGASDTKPYCDNSHQEAGFKDAGTLAVGNLAQSEGGESGQPLAITILANGPLRLQGPFIIRGTGSGEPQRGVKVSLCRCGASKRKPFCDGSHREAGFVAD